MTFCGEVGFDPRRSPLHFCAVLAKLADPGMCSSSSLFNLLELLVTVEAVTLSQFFSQEIEPTHQSSREQTLRE